ncbi:hypothetical protein CEP52_014530 [Fusarium oligoseptatum]|uniref:Uncharacterized protein n=1 Tax=Fusarium oligoseptatum TaxID=2604345 RepID=A0A428SL98_9HYPO|nr:hypothetical protein CEP52_014530 [Fusarium oligoseptatum]
MRRLFDPVGTKKTTPPQPTRRPSRDDHKWKPRHSPSCPGIHQLSGPPVAVEMASTLSPGPRPLFSFSSTPLNLDATLLDLLLLLQVFCCCFGLEPTLSAA